MYDGYFQFRSLTWPASQAPWRAERLASLPFNFSFNGPGAAVFRPGGAKARMIDYLEDHLTAINPGDRKSPTVGLSYS